MVSSVHAPHLRGGQFPVVSDPVVCGAAVTAISAVSKLWGEDVQGVSDMVSQVFNWMELKGLGEACCKKAVSNGEKAEKVCRLVLASLIFTKVLVKDMKVGHRFLKAHAPSLLGAAQSKTMGRVIMFGKVTSYGVSSYKEFKGEPGAMESAQKKAKEKFYSKAVQSMCFTVLLTTGNFGVPKGVNKDVVDNLAFFAAGVFGCVNVGFKESA